MDGIGTEPGGPRAGHGWAAIAAMLIALGATHAAAPTAAAAGRCGDQPWCDAELSPPERAALLLEAMTLEEKISLMGGDDATGVATGEPATGTSEGIPRLDVPTVYYSDGPVGPREGEATAMPAPLALAATFNPRVARLTGAAIASEVKHKANDVVHAPTVDILRTPLAGRSFETYGEDPLLSSRLAVPWIRGAQAEGVVANVKHFAPNTQEGQIGAPPLTALVGSRFTVDAVIDERTLREIYLPPFEAAVTRAGAGSVMCAYNRLNGEPACQNGELLERILRGDWGFDGYVLSDYGFATKSTAPSANNGLDLDMPLGFFYSPAALHAAVAAGEVSEETIDERVGAILETMFRFGIFDRPAFPDDEAAIDKRAHAAVARRVERQGIVLLRNRGLLPLGRRVRSIAVVGEAADRYVGGGGSSAVRPFSFTSPLEAIRRRAGDRVKVTYDPGETDAAAAAAARSADLAIVFAADHATEGVDKPCLALNCVAPDPIGGEPAGDAGRRDPDALIEAVAGANPKTVVVLETAGPVLTPWVSRVGAVLEAWYPGQEAGPALAAVLFGNASPSGRLPVTFPVDEGDIPTAGNPSQYPGVGERATFSEGVMIGYRHYQENGIRPRWSFGHGLSYTRFRLGGLRVVKPRTGARRTIARARFRVANTGRRRGTAVPQVYLGLPSLPGVAQPPRALKGWRRVALAPGRSRRVTVRLSKRAFSYWDADADRWRVAPGCYRVMLGHSSRRIADRARIALRGATCARTASDRAGSGR